ncbi:MULTISPECIES: aminopeptidase P family protein [Streptomyces]|uniref:aminopeptidase P family protein n=1 Tax=Streptomyces TaxID=1883 RepID=UPI0013BF844F|nr:aminopeptidase P family protein [Streptomyces ardesiacus]MCL7368335.1 aminopeptidase P family protein [Streptomyces ardesiacus]NEB60834.1 aminopeptidase P family protein [Streptomyces diastaticus]
MTDTEQTLRTPTPTPGDSAERPAAPAGPASGPVAEEPDPRMPRLAAMPAFVAYMGQGWGTPDRTAQVVPGAAKAAAEHRARLAAELPGRTIAVASGRASVRSNDTFYDFRPDSDFYWLTGCPVENAVLVMDTRAAKDPRSVLYLPRPAQPGDPGFFADAQYGELWVGAAPGPRDWARALGHGLEVRPLEDLDPALAEGNRDAQVARTLAELRMIKDDWEIAQLRTAVDCTVEGFAAVVREFPTAVAGGGERWLQGTFDRYARTYGNGPGYASIVGSGRHAATLHWVRCDGPVGEEEAVLLDMGVETHSYYTADVTRTFPATGRFSPAQRQVHDLVERAHRAGLAAVRPGRDFADFHTAAMDVIAHGLHDWGLLPVSVDEALSPEGQHHRRWLVCGVGHHLGLDVHDCARSSYEAYQGAPLAPGMVLTVEPGLYFHSHDLAVPPELRGIGVRIEDDVLVTPEGADVLSDALPLDATGLENWMR